MATRQMATRRTFLQAGMAAAGATVAVSGRTAAFAAAGWENSAPVLAVVHDRRFDDSYAFGDAAARYGLRVLPISGDMGRLWYRGLRETLERAGGLVAGLTTAPSADYARSLARDAGYHRIFRGDHYYAGGSDSRSPPERQRVVHETRRRPRTGPRVERDAVGHVDPRPARRQGNVTRTNPDRLPQLTIKLKAWSPGARAHLSAPVRNLLLMSRPYRPGASPLRAPRGLCHRQLPFVRTTNAQFTAKCGELLGGHGREALLPSAAAVGPPQDAQTV